MNAAEFWEQASDGTKILLAARLNPCPTVQEIFQPFASLPNALKAAVRESVELHGVVLDSAGRNHCQST